MKTKKALTRRLAILKLLPNLMQPLTNLCRSFHIKTIEEVVAQALITQAITNTSGSDKINFQIL